MIYYALQKCIDGGYYVRTMPGPDVMKFQDEIRYAGTQAECLDYVQGEIKEQVDAS